MSTESVMIPIEKKQVGLGRRQFFPLGRFRSVLTAIKPVSSSIRILLNVVGEKEGVTSVVTICVSVYCLNSIKLNF